MHTPFTHIVQIDATFYLSTFASEANAIAESIAIVESTHSQKKL